MRPAEGASASPLPVGYAPQPVHSADKNEYLLLFNPKLGLNHYPAEPAGFRLFLSSFLNCVCILYFLATSASILNCECGREKIEPQFFSPLHQLSPVL
mgnify:CR=1 FL=1